MHAELDLYMEINVHGQMLISESSYVCPYYLHAYVIKLLSTLLPGVGGGRSKPKIKALVVFTTLYVLYSSSPFHPSYHS